MTEMLTTKMLQARARTHLLQAPGMAAHILTLVTPPKGKAPGPKISGTRELPLPLNARALEDANGLYADLVNWATYWPRVLQAPPPASVLAWYRKDANCDGFPSWATVPDARELVRDATRWLIAAADRISEHPASDSYFNNIKELITPLFGRYPMAPRLKATSTKTCPVCDNRTVIVDFDADPHVMVACTYCGHDIPPKVYDRYVIELTLQHQAEEEPKEYWSIEDAMREAKVSRATVLRYIREGLPTYGAGEVVGRLEFLGVQRQKGANQASTQIHANQR